ELAVLAVDVQPAVGVADRTRPDTLVPPADLARGELDAHQPLAGRAVQEVAEQHRAADGVGQAALAVDRLGRHAARAGRQPQQGAEAAVAAVVDGVAADHWRRDVGGAFAGVVVAPQELAGLGVHADDALLHELDVLPPAAGLDGHHRGIAGLVAAR